MARPLNTTRLQEGVPARAPAFRPNVPARKTPDAATLRRYPGAPGARSGEGRGAPVLAPCVHVRDVPLRWYGIGGTG